MNIDKKYIFNLIRTNIKKYRRLRKYTQEQLAEGVGLSTDYICEIESLTKNKGFSIMTVAKISYFLNVPMEYFFTKDVTYK